MDNVKQQREGVRQFGRQVLEEEAAAIARLAEGLDESFDRAVKLILDCKGSVATSGVGKAGIIARKLSATLSSTGTPSHFLNPSDALHGDLGRLRKGDVVVLFSYSGETEELSRLLGVLKGVENPIVAITGSKQSTLGRYAQATLELGRMEEACPLGLAPSTTTTAMLALGDALALAVMRERAFTAEDFAVFHPAGQLGRRLMKVKEAMTFKLGENLPVASDRLTVMEVLREVSHIKRRCGAVVLTDGEGKLAGIFSDSDLRRLMTAGNGDVLSRRVCEVMTKNPKRVNQEALATEAMGLMKEFRIDEAPVVDDENRPVGLIDIQDLMVLKLFDVGPET